MLVADDIASMRSLMARLLRTRGFDVQVAADGEECLRLAGSYRPHLMILDIMMPKVHGVEVLRRVKADPGTAGIGVIVCTAKAYKQDHDQVRALGAFNVLVKPFEPSAFIEIVDRFFSGDERGAGAAASAGTAPATFIPNPPPGPSVRLWGTRGSIPVSGVRTVRHGGNTSCIEIRCGEEIIICDAGSGIRELGVLLARGRPRRLDIFITHTHWDHIQGFPFFAPAYIPGFELHVYGARGFRKDLRSVFSGQLDSDYFPVQFEDMRASIAFHVLDEPSLRLGGFDISWEFTHHPAATLAYKFGFGRRNLAYVSDNEFLHGYLGPPQDLQLSNEVVAPQRPLVDFLDGVDLLIAEAQYTNEEYHSKIGWGHSSVSNACVLAQLANVRRWIVTHHDPLHDDEFLDQKLNITKEIARVIGHVMEVRHGYDGLVEYW